MGVADHSLSLRRNRTILFLTKTTDSALTGTNLRLILKNWALRKSSVAASSPTSACPPPCARWPMKAIRSSWPEDACAAGTDALHRQELEIINMIYCHVMSGEELLAYLP